MRSWSRVLATVLLLASCQLIEWQPGQPVRTESDAIHAALVNGPALEPGQPPPVNAPQPISVRRDGQLWIVTLQVDEVRACGQGLAERCHITERTLSIDAANGDLRSSEERGESLSSP